MIDIFSQIDGNFARAVEDLVEACKFASTRDDESATNACADWLETRFENAGLESQRLQVKGSNPLVYASRRGQSSKRLLFFNHYDVERPGNEGDWLSPPFEPTIREGNLFARGTADNKGCLLARLHAIEAILQCRGSLPCDVAFAVEAKRDIFAPHFEQIVASDQHLFVADAYLWENALNDQNGRPTLRLGDKGMCVLEIRIRDNNQHPPSSMYAALFPGAAWEIVWTLSALRPVQDALPEWLTLGIEEFSAEERALLNNVPVEEDDSDKLRSIPDQRERLRTAPTFNLSSIVSGEVPSQKSSLSAIPTEAVAYLDIRLLPNQNPDRIIENLSEELSRINPRGQLRIRGKLHPHRTPPDHSFVATLERAAIDVWGESPRLELLSTASGTRDVIARISGSPIVGIGIAYPGSRIGRPNENIRLSDFKNGIKYVASIMCEFGGCA